MIYWLPLTQPSRWGRLVPPRPGRFPRRWPCRPGRLRKHRWGSASLSSLSLQTSASAAWTLTFLQGLVDEFLQLQSLLVPGLISQKGSNVLQGSLILLGRKKMGECLKKTRKVQMAVAIMNLLKCSNRETNYSLFILEGNNVISLNTSLHMVKKNVRISQEASFYV